MTIPSCSDESVPLATTMTTGCRWYSIVGSTAPSPVSDFYFVWRGWI